MNVITFARSPVIPKATKTSAGRGSSTRAGMVAAGATVVIAVSSLASCLDGDPRLSLVRQTCSRPVDDGLRAILIRRQQCQVDGPPGERRRLALHRPSAEHLHDGRAPSDCRHGALVPILERLRLLACDLAGDRLA